MREKSEPWNMNQKVKLILEKTKGKTVGLFIDNANWFYPQKELGWRISFSKLRKFLEDYYKLGFLTIYAGTPLDKKDADAFKKFCQAIETVGFKIVTKPLKKIWLNKDKTKFDYKCNFDVEIALDVARQIEKTDLVIIGSGDSDFLEVKKFVFENKKSPND